MCRSVIIMMLLVLFIPSERIDELCHVCEKVCTVVV
jgi:hypothetical protein